ncbi:hypothetical protein [Vibrio rotiferianus]|uniref:hypothetical protein n=1 Tax=Vibrio rotiferianus TaxID=190895 RepID=UPI0005EDFC20|nr:hypothetical protein [Vibrio rotiferianus]
MNKILKSAHKFQYPLLIVSAWLVVSQLNEFYVSKEMDVMGVGILGNAKVEHKMSALADSNELPILSVKGEHNVTTQLDINENIFTLATREQKKIEEETLQESQDLQIDHSIEASEWIFSRLNVNAITENGVIIDGRFRSVGDRVGREYIAPTGEVFFAKFIGVRGQHISFDINGKRVVKRYDF